MYHVIGKSDINEGKYLLFLSAIFRIFRLMSMTQVLKCLSLVTQKNLSINIGFKKNFNISGMYFYTLNVMKLRKYLLSEVFYIAILQVILRIFQFKLSVFQMIRYKKCKTMSHYLLMCLYFSKIIIFV